MKIHDNKRRERIYTHNKTVLEREKLLAMLPGWSIKKFNKILEALKQKEVIEVSNNEVKFFILPISEKEYKHVLKNETIHQSQFTDEESELLTLLSMQSKIS